jgi:hypothetical protein
MQNTDTIILKSHLNGLWFRAITKAIAIFLGGYYGFSIPLRTFLTFSEETRSLNLFLLAIPLVLSLGFAIFSIVRNNPTKWRNQVKFDIPNKLISISNQGSSSNPDALDGNGFVIPFSEVDFIQSQVYESFLSSAYYLLSVSVNGKLHNMVSMNDAYAYTQLFNRLEQELGFKTQVL